MNPFFVLSRVKCHFKAQAEPCEHAAAPTGSFCINIDIKLHKGMFEVTRCNKSLHASNVYMVKCGPIIGTFAGTKKTI